MRIRSALFVSTLIAATFISSVPSEAGGPKAKFREPTVSDICVAGETAGAEVKSSVSFKYDKTLGTWRHSIKASGLLPSQRYIYFVHRIPDDCLDPSADGAFTTDSKGKFKSFGSHVPFAATAFVVELCATAGSSCSGSIHRLVTPAIPLPAQP